MAGLLLGLTLYGGLAQTNAFWPLTSWQLFSAVRTADQMGWRAAAVVDGEEVTIPFAEMGRAYRGSHAVLNGLARASDGRRRAVCDSWRQGLADIGVGAGDIVIYRTTSHYRLDGDPPDRREKEAYRC